ncbi:hypothetical protein C2869_20475 [Saccharobesus litoralis]|uniref:histidine kinase n=1 Tax=Saccharobesus litoralis TaxID=2172099 RepID=A0A2S0VWR7_9ALTE|nr:response regulator [Saccharobesus litoralis]AWB68623.1 hypothetical protein C2869_20475 [Saccharobesus litoralis]
MVRSRRLNKPWLVAIALFLLGLVATSIVYQVKLTSEKEQSQTRFKIEANLRAKDIEAEFNRSYFQIASVGNLFISSQWVSHQEFLDFVAQVFPSFPESRRISIMAHLPHQQRQQFINSMRDNPEPYFKSFEFFDYQDQQKVTPPTIVGDKFTVLQYSYPIAFNMNFYGRNITPASPIWKNIAPVIFSGHALVSHITPPIMPITKQPFFLYQYPILKKTAKGQEEVVGLVVSSQYVSDVFKGNAVQKSRDRYHYLLIDHQGNQFTFPEEQLVDKNQRIPITDQQASYIQELNILGSRWQLIIQPKQKLTNTSSELLNNIWIAGVIISLTLALIAKLVYSQQTFLSEQVNLKTLALNKTLQQVNQQKGQLKQQNTQLELAVEQAKQAAKVKSEFLANMSHEIRTPLNGIVGFTEILKGTPLNQAQLEYLSKMEFSVKHLMTVINDILDFSKIESGNIKLEQAPMSIYSVIDYIKMSFEDIALQKGVQFNVELAKNVHPDLMGDLVRVNQILLNLCSNALKFTSQGSVTVKISMRDITLNHVNAAEQAPAYQVIFQVIDTGIGMNEATVETLFQAFTQADTSTTRRFGGTGLGLTISQKLCQLMGGQITVDSVEGVGSTFTANLVLQLNNKILVNDCQTCQFDENCNVLVIDDNPIALKMLEQFLTRMQVSPTPVTTAKHGLQLLQQSVQYQIILLDWTMPEMDGEQFMHELAAMNLGYSPKVIVISAYDTALIKKASENLPLPIQHIIQKPCSERSLYNHMQACLNNENYCQESVQEEHTALQGLNILVVEDNEINQVIIGVMLKSEGILFTTANNGKQALSELEQNTNYNVILMDIHMPEMDGVEATNHIRQHTNKQIANKPIIALTANVMNEDVEQYLAVGMNAHIAKPIDKQALKNAILALI